MKMEQYELFASEEEILREAPKWSEKEKNEFLNELKKRKPEEQKEFWQRCYDHWTEYR